MWMEMACWAGLVFMALIVLKYWAVLPSEIPSHFNGAGQPDAYSGKISLFMMPAIGLGLYLMLSVIRFFPHICNYPWPITEENAPTQYYLAMLMLASLKLEIIWSFAYINWGTIQVALKQSGGLGPSFMFIMLAAIFGTLGVYFWLAYRAR
jgi:hypothetical protein